LSVFLAKKGLGPLGVSIYGCSLYIHLKYMHSLNTIDNDTISRWGAFNE